MEGNDEDGQGVAEAGPEGLGASDEGSECHSQLHPLAAAVRHAILEYRSCDVKCNTTLGSNWDVNVTALHHTFTFILLSAVSTAEIARVGSFLSIFRDQIYIPFHCSSAFRQQFEFSK